MIYPCCIHLNPLCDFSTFVKDPIIIVLGCLSSKRKFREDIDQEKTHGSPVCTQGGAGVVWSVTEVSATEGDAHLTHELQYEGTVGDVVRLGVI